MISAQRRNEIIDTGIVSVYTQFRFNNRIGNFDVADVFFNDFHNFEDEEKKDGIRVFNSNNQRLYRLHKRIKNILSKGKCVFLTLTFRDDILDSTSPETRRRYVSRFLSANYEEYVANIDFGFKNEREHYHAVCLMNDKADFTQWHKKCGAIKSKNIWQPKSSLILAKYITKLTNHAIKETNKYKKLIYSRDI